ncbi:MAG: nitroreductase family protein [Oscillospiraceae bacterium]
MWCSYPGLRGAIPSQNGDTACYARRNILVDVGHVGQNLYLACTGLGLGTCGIGAFSHACRNRVCLV